jgi:hypothetical protein
MLDKIKNIDSGSDYRGPGSQFLLKKNPYQRHYSRGTELHDSVNISPALLFLNQINWKLKDFKHEVNEKLFIDFIVSNIEFQTNIEIVSLNSLHSLNYNIIKGNEEDKKGKILAQLSVNLDGVDYERDDLIVNFNTLHVFLERLFKLNIETELSVGDSLALKNLLDGLMSGIKNELDHVNSLLFIFFDKLTGIKLKNDDRWEDVPEPVSIKKIKLINAK